VLKYQSKTLYFLIFICLILIPCKDIFGGVQRSSNHTMRKFTLCQGSKGISANYILKSTFAQPAAGHLSSITIQHYAGFITGNGNKAIILTGIYDGIDVLAESALTALRNQGYSEDRIFYLSANISDGHFIKKTTNQTFRYAIQKWAVDADNLLIYVAGHGEKQQFKLNSNEILFSEDLNSWLLEAEKHIYGKIYFIYEACKSGSFLTLSKEDRVIVSSSSDKTKALFGGAGSVSFSFYFWSRLNEGSGFYSSFVNAKKSIEMTNKNQDPQIDTNGDGKGNKPEDKKIAQTLHITKEYGYLVGDPPSINKNSITPSLSLTAGETSVVLYAENIVDLTVINRVWAAIIPPNYLNNSTSRMFDNFPVIDLVRVPDNRFEYTYNGFAEKGTYTISILAEDADGIISDPVNITITQTQGTSFVGDITGDSITDLKDIIVYLRIMSNIQSDYIRSDYFASNIDLTGNDIIDLIDVVCLLNTISSN